MSTLTPNPRGALFRRRAWASAEYNLSWRRAQADEVAAVKAARAAFIRATEAAQDKRDEDYPDECHGCEGGTRPECDGCELFIGEKV